MVGISSKKVNEGMSLRRVKESWQGGPGAGS